MEDIILNSLMLAVSIVAVNLYLWYVKKRCGRCSSISRSVKYLTKVNEVALFYLFVTFGICFPLGYLVYTNCKHQRIQNYIFHFIITFRFYFLYNLKIILNNYMHLYKYLLFFHSLLLIPLA
jgi:hypothetical protein